MPRLLLKSTQTDMVDENFMLFDTANRLKLIAGVVSEQRTKVNKED